MPLPPRILAAPILTVLDPDERLRVDAAGAGLYRAIHRESVADALEWASSWDIAQRPNGITPTLLVYRCIRD